jgi:hypothetical protein
MEMYNNVDEIENLCNGIKYHCILMLLSSSTLPVSNASRGIAANSLDHTNISFSQVVVNTCTYIRISSFQERLNMSYIFLG